MASERGHEPIYWGNLSILLHQLPDQAAWMCPRRRQAILQAIFETASKVTAKPTSAVGEAPKDLISANVDLTLLGLRRSDSISVANGDLVAVLIDDKLHFYFYENGDPDPDNDPTSPKSPRNPLNRSTTPTEFVRAVNKYLAGYSSTSSRRLSNFLNLSSAASVLSTVRIDVAAHLSGFHLTVRFCTYLFEFQQAKIHDLSLVGDVCDAGYVGGALEASQILQFLHLPQEPIFLRSGIFDALNTKGCLVLSNMPDEAMGVRSIFLSDIGLGGNRCRPTKRRDTLWSYGADDSEFKVRLNSLRRSICAAISGKDTEGTHTLNPNVLDSGGVVPRRSRCARSVFLGRCDAVESKDCGQMITEQTERRHCEILSSSALTAFLTRHRENPARFSLWLTTITPPRCAPAPVDRS
jgi:hypothetical protein